MQEFRIHFDSGSEARRFLQAFLAGCARVGELTARDQSLLVRLEPSLLKNAVGSSEQAAGLAEETGEDSDYEIEDDDDDDDHEEGGDETDSS